MYLTAVNKNNSHWQC